MGRALFPALLLSLLASNAAAITIDAPTDQWSLVGYASPTDWADDQATGANEADIVGDADHGALYTFFDDLGTASLTDGVLGFRLRLGSDDNPGGFKHVAVVGMDIDADFTVDMLIVVDNKGGSPEIAIRPVDGDGSSPAETAIETSGGVSFTPTPTNYSWMAVSALSDPGGSDSDIDDDASNDYFLSFSVDFQALVSEFGGAIDETSTLSYVAGTSTNSNSVNQDWVGPQGGAGSAVIWSTLGGFSNTRTITTTPVPEPRTALMLTLGLLALSVRQQRRKAGSLIRPTSNPVGA
jgi:hypothetical protein